ncbi:MAG: peptide deformylase [Patescibacteria group bacterium]|jgi:peptide deformylase
MKVITLPDPRLRLRAKKISLTKLAEPKFQRFILDLAKIMKTDQGIGIAAPQVAESVRLMIVEVDGGPMPFVNPQILWKSIRQEVGEEGCLSVPGVYGLVKRARQLLLTYQEPSGKRKNLRAKGLLARVLQHEIDHLNGILFIDRMIK